jgi:hypothetical protein
VLFFHQKILTMQRQVILKSAVLLATCLSSQAVIVWSGGGGTDDFYDSNNWDFSGSGSALVASPTDDDMTIAGATISEPSGAFTNIEIGDGLSVTLDATSFTFANNNGFSGVNDAGDVLSVLNIVNGSFFSAQFAAIGITINVDATSSLLFRGGGDPINSQIEKTTINLEPGAQLSLASFAEFAEQGADIVVNGVTFADDPSILSISGTTGTAIAPVPEPSSSILAALGALALLARRRK